MSGHPRAGLAGRLARRGLPRRTVRLRLSVLYGGLFLVSGAGLLGVTYLLVADLPPYSRISSSPDLPRPGGLRGLRVYNQHLADGLAARVSFQRAADLHELLVRSGIALVIMVAVSIWLGWLMAGRVLRPLRVITAAARQISEDNLHQRLALQGPDDELKELGDTVDGLLGRLEGAFDAQRSFVANASHELRTPLAMMRTSLDVAEGKSPPVSKDASVLAGKVREGLDQADRLVESFLVLARAQRGVMTDLATVSLPGIASSALDSRRSAVADLGLAVHQHLGDAEVIGSETLLARMVANVVDNAVGHNERGGFVDVTTEADGRTARVIVESGGPHLDQDKLPQLGQPFRRLTADRTAPGNGVGLGLSIVAAIATAHRGTLAVRARPQGGLRVVIELPHATPPAGPAGNGVRR
jgi:signal transduction histidine kinase